MYYVMRSAMPDQQGFSSQAGKKHPAHAVSSGRALLFDLQDNELELLYRGYNFANFPSFVPQDLPALKTRLAEERAQGFVITPSLSYESIRHIAVPVRDASGAATAAINVSDRDYSDSELTGFVLDELKRTSEAISGALGYRVAPLRP
jgi:IclR family pca regulon transcriptional regulator